MESSPVLMDAHENGYQYVQCNPHQNSNDILHRDRKINPKVHMEAQMTLSSQGNTELKVQYWKYHNT
jgi:hypothetical protein